MRVVEVEFAAPAGGTAPLTWGQREIWRSLLWLGEQDHYFNSAFVLAVPDGRSDAEVHAAVRAFVERHEGMRTRFPNYATEPYQEVPATGVIQICEYDCVEAAIDEATEEASRQLRDRSFRHDVEFPVRIGVVRSDDRPRRLILAVSHQCVDGGGGRVLRADLAALLAGAVLPDQGSTWSPRQVAEFEQSPSGARRHASAARRWRQDLLAMPASIFDYPAHPQAQPRFWDHTIESPAIAVACDRIANALEQTNSTVLLAGCAAMLSHYTGHPDVGMHLIVANRSRAEVRETITAMTENGLFTVHLGGLSFAEAVAACWNSAFTSFRTAQYDPVAMDQVIADVERERGAFCEREAAFYNDIRATDRWEALPLVDPDEVELTKLLPETRISVTDKQERLALKAFFEVYPAPDRAVILLQVDSRCIPPDTAREMLLGLEKLLVRAAYHPVALAEIGALTGIEPVRRGDDWVRYGPGWYRPAAVEELLTGLDSVATASVSVGPDGAPVARVVSVDEALTVADLHEQVYAALRERTDVVAPARYTLAGADGEVPREGSGSS